jgi:DNA polymerase I-like protein with 3'-5' exonuclease and polymerase domains
MSYPTFPLTEVCDLPTRVDLAILDTETTGKNVIEDTPFLLIADLDGREVAVRWTPTLARWISDVLPQSKRCVFHAAKFDSHMFINGGVHPDVVYSLPTYCTLVAEALLDEHKFVYGLDALGMEYWGINKTNTELYDFLAAKLGGKADRSQMGNLIHAPIELVAYYGMGDIDLTRRLYQRQQPLIAAQDAQFQALVAMEMKAVKVFMEMERRGVRVDVAKTREVEAQMLVRQAALQAEITQMVGFEVNPRAPSEMIRAFNGLNIPIRYNKPTAAMIKKGLTVSNPCFNKEMLAMINHPFIGLLEKSRSIKTMLDTFIGGTQGKARNGRIHANINQTKSDEGGTGTGRLSYSDPNLQQTPKRDGELAPLVRGLFIPEDGHDWISNDWAQFEFRIFAHFARDPALLARYIADPTTDFHQAASDMTGKPRNLAKRINLGLVFGMGEGKLAKECDLPYTIEESHGKTYLRAGDEAQAMFAEYHSKFPFAKRFLTQAGNVAKSRGFVKTILGRHIHFPGGLATHKAGGLVFQGSAADIMKQKCIVINDEFRKTDVLFNLVVHDEFCLSSPKELTPSVMARVQEITQDVPEFRVPILADPGFGPSWWEACQ